MMQQLKMVVRFRDGRVLKGTTDNFNPLTGGFHLHLVPGIPGVPGVPDAAQGRPVPVRLSELKAIFIVQDFRGKPGHVERKTFNAAAKEAGATIGARLRITFVDGETLVGSTLNYDPAGPGFFLFPADCDSNNQRVYVVNAAVREVKNVA